MSIRIGDAAWDLPQTVERSLENIELSIDGLPGDPGPLYNIDERVRRVVGALQGKIGALESRGHQ